MKIPSNLTCGRHPLVTRAKAYSNPTNRRWDHRLRYQMQWLLYLAEAIKSLQWRHNEHDGVSNHQRPDCLLNRLFRRRLKKISKLRVTGLCVGNSPVTGEFPTQRASNTENVSIWWRHHDPSYIKSQISLVFQWNYYRQYLHALQVTAYLLKKRIC